MKAKFTEGQIVRDLRFKETHRVRDVLFSNRTYYYGVENVSGPGAYQGHEVWAEKDLEAVKD